MPRLLFVAALVAALAMATASLPNTLACRPGVSPRVFDRTWVAVPRGGAKALHTRLKGYAGRSDLSVGSVESSDPYEKPPLSSMTTILQTDSFGTVLEVTASNRTPFAKVTVGNNCWAPRENWRPHWRRLKAFLAAAGYRRKP